MDIIDKLFRSVALIDKGVGVMGCVCVWGGVGGGVCVCFCFFFLVFDCLFCFVFLLIQFTYCTARLFTISL